jgi:hypothetical protein
MSGSAGDDDAIPRADEPARASPLSPPVLALHQEPGLPRWTLPVALVGLAILVVSVLPALVARRRLDAAQRHMEEDIRTMEGEAARYSRERQALASDLYVLDRTVRDLMQPGMK